MKTITTQELERMMEEREDLLVLNVLSEEDFERVHIPGSRNLPVDTENFAEGVEEMAGGKDRPVVVHCADEDCQASPKAVKRLDDAGFERVYDYEGGIKEWMKTRHEVERSKAQTLS